MCGAVRRHEQRKEYKKLKLENSKVTVVMQCTRGEKSLSLCFGDSQLWFSMV